MLKDESSMEIDFSRRFNKKHLGASNGKMEKKLSYCYSSLSQGLSEALLREAFSLNRMQLGNFVKCFTDEDG